MVKTSDSSETNDYYEEYRDESSSSVVVLTPSSCTYDTSTTLLPDFRVRWETRSLAYMLQKATPLNLCRKRTIQKDPSKGYGVRFHLVIPIQSLLSILKGVPNFQANHLLFQGINYFVLLAGKSFLLNGVSSKIIQSTQA